MKSNRPVTKGKIALLVFCFLLVYCGGFPFYNFEREWVNVLGRVSRVSLLLGSWFLGTGLAGFFPRLGLGKVFAVSTALVGMGMLCRYLLEYGEVSNIYNFTAPNVAVHLVVTIGVACLAWLWARRMQ